MARIPIAAQLYWVDKQARADLPGVLQAVFDMGYDGVEFAGFYGYGAADLRELLDDYGLDVCGSHTPLDELIGDNLAATVDYNRVLGNRILVVPALPRERAASRCALLDAAKLLNSLADRLEPHGMRVGIHCHPGDFQPMGDSTAWELLCENADERVITQLDCGNALAGGADPIRLVQRFPARATTVQLKAHSDKKAGAIVGEGAFDWRRFLDLCQAIGGTRWFVVEQETYRYDPLDTLWHCMQNLEEMGR